MITAFVDLSEIIAAAWAHLRVVSISRSTTIAASVDPCVTHICRWRRAGAVRCQRLSFRRSDHILLAETVVALHTQAEWSRQLCASKSRATVACHTSTALLLVLFMLMLLSHQMPLLLPQSRLLL